MSSLKYTALPLILALAVGGCSTEVKNYPNFKACYNDTGDANKCVQYVPDTTNNTPNQSTVGSNSDDGIDGSSALTGAAVGAAAGYALANTSNSKRRRDDDNAVIVPPSNRNTNSTGSNSSTTKPNKSSKPSLTKSKSSTTRGGFGSTGSKSFGG